MSDEIDSKKDYVIEVVENVGNVSLLLIRTCVYFTLNSNEQASVVISQNQHGNMKNGSEKNEELLYQKIVKKKMFVKLT